jgi:hypothetical protein
MITASVLPRTKHISFFDVATLAENEVGDAILSRTQFCSLSRSVTTLRLSLTTTAYLTQHFPHQKASPHYQFYDVRLHLHRKSPSKDAHNAIAFPARSQ